jgi:nitric oxide reductase subunit B
MFGDTIFAFGALVLGWFVLGLVTGHSFDRGSKVLEEGQYTTHEEELVHQGD